MRVIIPSADNILAVSTAALWGATVILAITDAGSTRLHLTCLAGGVLTGIGVIVQFAVKHLRDHLRDNLLHGVDELHAAVDTVKTHVLHFDRAYVLAARGAMEGILKGTQKNGLDGMDREVASWESSGEWPIIGDQR